MTRRGMDWMLIYFILHPLIGVQTVQGFSATACRIEHQRTNDVMQCNLRGAVIHIRRVEVGYAVDSCHWWPSGCALSRLEPSHEYYQFLTTSCNGKKRCDIRSGDLFTKFANKFSLCTPGNTVRNYVTVDYGCVRATTTTVQPTTTRLASSMPAFATFPMPPFTAHTRDQHFVPPGMFTTTTPFITSTTQEPLTESTTTPSEPVTPDLTSSTSTVAEETINLVTNVANDSTLSTVNSTDVYKTTTQPVQKASIDSRNKSLEAVIENTEDTQSFAANLPGAADNSDAKWVTHILVPFAAGTVLVVLILTTTFLVLRRKRRQLKAEVNFPDGTTNEGFSTTYDTISDFASTGFYEDMYYSEVDTFTSEGGDNSTAKSSEFGELPPHDNPSDLNYEQVSIGHASAADEDISCSFNGVKTQSADVDVYAEISKESSTVSINIEMLDNNMNEDQIEPDLIVNDIYELSGIDQSDDDTDDLKDAVFIENDLYQCY